MKKIISLFATVAMLSTLFVSVVRADGLQPTVSSVATKLASEEYYDLTGETLDAGDAAYIVSVSLTGMGDLSCTTSKKGGKTVHTGRKIFSTNYNMAFEDAGDVRVLYNLSNFLGVEEVTENFEGNEFRSAPQASGAATAYPKVNGETVANDESIDDALTYLIVVDGSKQITATLDAGMVVQYYDQGSSTGYDPEVCNHATMTPASLVFGAAAPVEPTPVYTDSSIDVKKSDSGKTGLTDLQGKDVTLTANYGIAKFSKAIDTAANDYFVVATDSNDEEKVFDVDFGAKGVEISNASTTFFAIVKSADHIIKNIRLKEVAK